MGDMSVQPPCLEGYHSYDWSIPEGTYEDPAMETLSGNCRVMRYENISLNGKYVGESIDKDYLHWDYITPVLIDAPTGSGKSTFVCEQLIPDAARMGKNLLLVSNRTALVRQQRQLVFKAVYGKQPYAIQPRDEEIAEYKFWGNVCVCTYHALEALVHKAEHVPELKAFFDNILYAVFDEIHFLYADATFVNSCGRLLENIPAYFHRSVRIYMTATAASICNSLMYSEKVVYHTLAKVYGLEKEAWSVFPVRRANLPPRPTFLHYYMPRNFDRYRLHFFSDQYAHDLLDVSQLKSLKYQGDGSKRVSAVLNCIPEPSSQNKTLIFVQKREDGLELEKVLNARRQKKKCEDPESRDAIFIDRRSKFEPEIDPDFALDEDEPDSPEEAAKNARARAEAEEQQRKNEAWSYLLKTGKFDYNVLISTPVLDCGINITEEHLKTIVIFADDETSLLQMLGRKRLDPKTNDVVDVWVYVPKSGHFKQLADIRKRELQLADRVNFINVFRYHHPDIEPGPVVSIFDENGNVIDVVQDNEHKVELKQHEEVLASQFTHRYNGESFYGFYRKFWQSYGRVSDKALFRFTSFGQVYVDTYTQWVVSERMRYYNSLNRYHDFRMVVACWMGKEKELQSVREAKRDELIAFLQNHLEKPVSEPERDTLCRLTAEAHALCFTSGTRMHNSKSMRIDAVRAFLTMLGVPYNIYPKSRKSKDWIVKYEPK